MRGVNLLRLPDVLWIGRQESQNECGEICCNAAMPVKKATSDNLLLVQRISKEHQKKAIHNNLQEEI
jgi:hypothetical protein